MKEGRERHPNLLILYPYISLLQRKVPEGCIKRLLSWYRKRAVPINGGQTQYTHHITLNSQREMLFVWPETFHTINYLWQEGEMKFFSQKSHLLQSADKELVRKVRSNQNAWDYSEKKGDFSRVNSIERNWFSHTQGSSLFDLFFPVIMVVVVVVVCCYTCVGSSTHREVLCVIRVKERRGWAENPQELERTMTSRFCPISRELLLLLPMMITEWYGWKNVPVLYTGDNDYRYHLPR